jgi:hypothetical protein
MQHRHSRYPKNANKALRVITKGGRAGAAASEIGKNESQGIAIGLTLVARGGVTVTRNNRFILRCWKKKIVPPRINWDDDQGQGDERDHKRRVGMIEPNPLPLPRQRKP